MPNVVVFVLVVVVVVVVLVCHVLVPSSCLRHALVVLVLPVGSLSLGFEMAMVWWWQNVLAVSVLSHPHTLHHDDNMRAHSPREPTPKPTPPSPQAHPLQTFWLKIKV